MFLKDPPSLLVMPNPRGEILSFIEKEIIDNYRVVYENMEYILYRLVNHD